MRSSDLFLVLDNVQFSKGEWQNRNKLVDSNGTTHFITLPLVKSPLSTLISQKHIQPTFVTDSHLSKFSNYYRRSPFFFFPHLSSFYNDSFSSPLFLSDFNIALFSRLATYTGLNPSILKLSSFIPLFRTSPVTLKLISSFIFVNLMLLHMSSFGLKPIWHRNCISFLKIVLK